MDCASCAAPPNLRTTCSNPHVSPAVCARPTAVRHVIPAIMRPSSHAPPGNICVHWRAPTNRSKSPSGDTSNRAADTSAGGTAYSHTCAASQHWKLICAYSCARALADHGCAQQTSGLFLLYDQTVTASRRRPAVTPRSLLHVACAGIGIFSRHCRTSRADGGKSDR